MQDTVIQTVIADRLTSTCRHTSVKPVRSFTVQWKIGNLEWRPTLRRRLCPRRPRPSRWTKRPLTVGLHKAIQTYERIIDYKARHKRSLEQKWNECGEILEQNDESQTFYLGTVARRKRVTMKHNAGRSRDIKASRLLGRASWGLNAQYIPPVFPARCRPCYSYRTFRFQNDLCQVWKFTS